MTTNLNGWISLLLNAILMLFGCPRPGLGAPRSRWHKPRRQPSSAMSSGATRWAHYGAPDARRHFTAPRNANGGTGSVTRCRADPSERTFCGLIQITSRTFPQWYKNWKHLACLEATVPSQSAVGWSLLQLSVCGSPVPAPLAVWRVDQSQWSPPAVPHRGPSPGPRHAVQATTCRAPWRPPCRSPAPSRERAGAPYAPLGPSPRLLRPRPWLWRLRWRWPGLVVAAIHVEPHSPLRGVRLQRRCGERPGPSPSQLGPVQP
mmetsp:Transcript_16053/g.38297  ORF Transcript_16053/g.38297 Transcript_16053/m.38297 type:complete len:261 (-) Transcript_16053:329-1111(-)